jgi:hypothetical protein
MKKEDSLKQFLSRAYTRNGPSAWLNAYFAYLLLVSRSDRESSCCIHGSREHGAKTGLRGRVANGLFAPRLPVHDWTQTGLNFPRLESDTHDSSFFPHLRCLQGAWSTLASTTRVDHASCNPGFKVKKYLASNSYNLPELLQLLQSQSLFSQEFEPLSRSSNKNNPSDMSERT